MRDANGLQYFLTDHPSTGSGHRLGSTVAVTDASGTLTSQQRYLPFGGVRTDIDTVTETDLGYTGQRALDPGMGGLIDYKARFYSPILGRFIQPDSIIPGATNPQNWNRYTYVGNSPILYNDPTGHDSILSEFLAGVASEVLSSVGWFSPQLQESLAPKESESVAMLAGRVVGDIVAMAGGVAVAGTGAGGIAGGTLCVGLTVGGCLPAGAPTVVAGAALVVEGAGTAVRGAVGLGANTYLLAKKIGIFSRPSSWRKSTLDDAWEGADDGSNGGKRCPECGKEVYVKPGSGPRDWHADHIFAWIKRNLSNITTRKGVLDEYNEGIQLLCPTCNLKKGPK